MAADPRIGHSTTITFGTTTFAADWRSLSYSGEQRDEVETTHLGSESAQEYNATPADAVEQGFKEFIPGMTDPGTITAEIWLDPALLPADPAVLLEIPTRQQAESITITFPPGSGTGAITMTFTGFVSTGGWNITPSGAMEATLNIKLSGVPVFGAVV